MKEFHAVGFTEDTLWEAISKSDDGFTGMEFFNMRGWRKAFLHPEFKDEGHCPCTKKEKEPENKKNPETEETGGNKNGQTGDNKGD